MNSNVNLYGEVCALTAAEPEIQSKLWDTIQKYTVVSTSKSSSWEDCVEAYINNRIWDGLSKKTISNYKHQLDMFGSYLNFIPPVAVSTEHIHKYLVYLHDERNLKNSSINQYSVILSTFFKWLVKKHYIEINPWDDIAKKQEEVTQPSVLTKDDIQKIKELNIKLRNLTILMFFTTTGCRVSEVESLKWNDINWEDDSVIVRGKGDKVRTVYFNNETKELLKKYYEVTNNKDDLFSCDRAPYGKLHKEGYEAILHKMGEEIGIRLYPHKCRHYYCNNLYNNGTDLPIIQLLMGHSSPVTTTKTYLHLDKDTIKNAYFAAMAK